MRLDGVFHTAVTDRVTQDLACSAFRSSLGTLPGWLVGDEIIQEATGAPAETRDDNPDENGYRILRCQGR